jgi:tetratricopeptide (TPR) repeat protein
LARRGDTRNALSAVAEALKLRPQDSEAMDLENMLRQPNPPALVPAAMPAQKNPIQKNAIQKNPTPKNAAPNSADSGNDTSGRRTLPLERIKRSYNDASFRQAASEMEEMEAQHLASLPLDQQAAALTRNGKTYLGRGLMLEAEREFQLALAANSNDADARAGLAEVHRRNGDDAQARSEAQASLKLRPNAAAWLTLARLDRTQHQLPAAREDVTHALDVDPGNSDARGLQQSLTTVTPPAAANPRP